MTNAQDLEQACSSRLTAETKMADSEEIFRLLVDAVDEYAIFALDIHGTILTWNQGGTRLKGYQPAEVIGTHFSRFYTASDIERNHPEEELRLAASNGKYEEEGWRVRKDGTTFWANVVITALRGLNGEVKGFGKVTRDLTQRRNAELALKDSEERFRLLVENVSDYAILFLDPKGRITSWNSGATRITGYEAKEILGAHFSKFYSQEDIAGGKPQLELKTATEKGKYEEEGWRVRKNGTTFWANVIITAVRDKNGDLLGFSKITRDLTERKRAEDELRSAYGDLEKRIVVRTKELSDAKEKAEAAVKTRDEFFSMASHELKTPLSSMKLQTQIRKRNIRKGNLKDFAPEKLESLCEEDERQVERLAFLVENMLDISKLTSGLFKLSYETLNLVELVKDVMNRMKPILKQSGNECTLLAACEIIGTWDRVRLEQVLINLLSNAGKYAPGKPVQVELSNNDGKVQILVRDHGRGIAEADQQRVFGSYERVKDHGETTGLGLGLYISKQIIEAHSGEIRVESFASQGSTFIVKLPLKIETTLGISK